MPHIEHIRIDDIFFYRFFIELESGHRDLADIGPKGTCPSWRSLRGLDLLALAGFIIVSAGYPIAFVVRAAIAKTRVLFFLETRAIEVPRNLSAGDAPASASA